MTVGSAPTGVLRPISAGVVSALVGFTSAFVVVLSGLAGVGADPDQASSGLILLTGLLPQLGALIAGIPASVAQAMLAGVLFQLCLGPITGLATNPLAVAPVVAVWLLAMRFLPRWAAPLAFLTAAVVISIHIAVTGAVVDPAALVPRVEITGPAFTMAGLLGIALPLYLVTMASQNVPGVAVMA